MKRKPRSLWITGSVALADILANSVAVILILIVVTLSVQQQQAERQLDQNADITTILARQLATTVVYNDLPSSPPARLHDYNSCAIPHDCDPSLYPIVEMHHNYLREYNTNLRFYRDELLQPENPFDDLIKTFSDADRLNIRIDIYDVNLYYLAMGILKEHNINPRHWHYLGEQAQPPISPKQALTEGGYTENLAPVNEAAGDNFNADNQQTQTATLPEGTEYADAQALEALQLSELLPPSEEGSSQTGQGGASAEASDPSNGQSDNQAVTPDTLLESLVQLLNNGGNIADDAAPNQNQLNGNNRPNQRSMRLRVPNASGNQSDNPNQQPLRLQIQADRYDATIITFLLDQLMLARHQRSAFVEGAREVLMRYAQQPERLTYHPQSHLVKQIVDRLTDKQNDSQLRSTPLIISRHKANQLYLATNQPGSTNTLLVDSQQATWSEGLEAFDAHSINLILRSFPGLFAGQKMTIPEQALILVHPNEYDQPELQWRPIVISDVWLQNPAIGFVRAALHNNQLLLDPQTHQTQINNILIAEPTQTDSQKPLFNTQWLYLIMLLALIVIVSSPWLVKFRWQFSK